ncbi:MAG: fibronectin type III domain-containing protein, partial [Bacteroidales bacterium]|nr:fibronectin type III domain-containing protein [Bacteroidales bacterium]
MTDKDDTSTFVSLTDEPVDDFAGTNTGTFHQFQVGLDGVPSDAVLALRYTMAESGGSNTSWYIDAVKVDEMPSCPSISGELACTSTTQTEATLSFTDNENSSWKIYYKLSSEEDYKEDNVIETSENEVTLQNLSSSTTYNAYVVPVCSAGQGEASAAISFKTACGSVSELPWTEGFEEGDGSLDCWTITEKNSAGFPNLLKNNTTYAHSGNTSMEFRDYRCMIATPAFTEDINNLILTFWVKTTSNWNANTGYIVVGAMSNPLDSSTFEAVDTVVFPDHTNYFEVTVDFAGTQLTGSDNNIALIYDLPNFQQNSWYLDDFKVSLIPSCAAPSKNSVELTDRTSSSLTVAFTDNNESHEAWKIYYKEDGTNDWQHVEADSPEGTEISDLKADTRYEIYVVTLCGGEDGDDSTSHVYFKTACATIPAADLPYYTGFEAGSEALDCWTKVTNPDYAFVTQGSSASYEGNYTMEIKGGDALIALPLIDEDLSQLRLTFWYRQNAMAMYNYDVPGKMEIGVMTDIMDTSSFTAIKQLADFNDGDQYDWHYESVLLNGSDLPEGDNRYIAIKYTDIPSTYPWGNYYTNSWYFDEVKVNYIPQCVGIDFNSVEVSQVTNTTAKVTFEDNTETNNKWNVYYKAEGSDTELQVMAVTDKEAELTNLEANTVYTVWVKVNCGSEESEDSSIVVTFTTKTNPVSVPYEQDFEGDDIKDFAFSATDPSYSWYTTYPWVIGSATAKDGSKSMYLGTETSYQSFYGYGTYAYAALNVQFGDKAEYSIEFDVKAEGYYYSWNSENDDSQSFLSVYLTDGDVPATGYPSGKRLNTERIYQMSDWTHVSYEVTGVENTQQQLIFVWHSYGGGLPAAIDNLSITGNDCAKPSDVATPALGEDYATVTWGGNNGQSWSLYYIKEEDNTGDDAPWTDVLNITDTFYTITGLEGRTKYNVYVIADCGDEGNAKSSVIAFRTTSAVAEVTDNGYILDFEDESKTNVVDMTSSNEETMYWTIGTAPYDSLGATGKGTALYLSDDTLGSYHYQAGIAHAYATIPVKFGDKKEYQISFDYMVGGYGYGDYNKLYVYLMPATSEVPQSGLPAGTRILSAYNADTWTSFKSEPLNDVSNKTYYLVFYWYNNSYMYGTNPPAAVDNITIMGNDCPQPTELTVNDLSDESADLQWKENGEASLWTIHYRLVPGGDEQTKQVSPDKEDNIVKYTLDGLAAGAKYSVYVTADCSQSSSNSSNEVTFSTLGKTVKEFPFVMDFEDAAKNNTFTMTGNGSNQWYIGSAVGVADLAGDGTTHHALYVSDDNGDHNTCNWNSTSYTYAAMSVQFGDDAEYNLEFDYYTGGRETGSNLNLYLLPSNAKIPTSGEPQYNNGGKALMRNIYGVNAWKHASFKLDGVKGQIYQIVFYWHNGVETPHDPAPAIDNIRIEGSNCASVSNLRMEGRKKPYSINLHWTDNEESVESWTVYYREKDAVALDFNKVVVDDSSYVISELEPGATYAIKVTANCGENSESVPTYLEETTECLPIDASMGWFDGFDINKYTENRAIPICWTRLKATPSQDAGTGYNVLMPSIITFANTGVAKDPTSLEFRYSGTIATPYFDGDVQDLSLEINAVRTSSGNMLLYVADDIYDSTTWEPIYSLPYQQVPSLASVDGAYNYRTYTIPLNNILTKGENKAIVFEYTDNTISSWYMDNVRVSLITNQSTPAEVCEETLTLKVDDADENMVTNDSTSATVSWTTTGLDEKWQYKLNRSGKFIDATTQSATFNDLIPGTEYTVYVRSYCDSSYFIYDTVQGGYNSQTFITPVFSTWDSIKFTTSGINPMQCDDIVDLEVTETTDQSVSVSWSGNSDAYDVAITKALDASASYLTSSEIVTVSDTKYTFDQLLDSTDYRVYVRQVCQYNNSDWDSIDVTTLKKYVAPEVTTSIATAIDSNVATLTGSVKWNSETPNIKGFELRLATDPESAAQAYQSESTGTNFEYTATELSSSTEYSFRAYAQAIDGTKFYGSWETFKTTEWIPNKPVVKTTEMAEADYDSIKATFRATVTLGDEAIVTRGFVYQTSGSAAKTVTVDASSSEFAYTVNDLKEYTEYTYYAFVTTAYYTGTKRIYGDTLTFRTLPSATMTVPPTVETLEAENIDSTTATINGKVTKHEQGADITEVGFFYGTTTAMSEQTLVNYSGQTDISADLSGLKPLTKYYYCAYAVADGDTTKGDVKNFTTLIGKIIDPTVTTLDATAVDSVKATLNGNIVKGTQNISQSGFKYFVSGTSDTTRVTSQVIDGNYYANVANLKSNTQYVYFAYAVTDSGEYRGEDKMFTTLEGPKVYPTVQTYSASTVTESGATLNGRVKAGNVEVIEQGFAYKVKEAEGDYTMVTVTSAEEQISYDVTGLLDSTVYTYYAYAKVNATTGDSIIRSENDVEFTTLKKTIVETDPVVRTADASGIDSVKATLNATVTVTETTKAIVSSGFMYRKAT